MFSHDAGHTHGPTLGFVTDCPLCDAAKVARNQAIGHLAEALRLMAAINPTGVQPTIRFNLSPIGITGDDTPHCHSIDLTAKHAEALSDAIDSMNAHASSQPTEDGLLGAALQQAEAVIDIDEDRMAQSTARFMGWLQGQAGEVIESGEWSADAVAQNDPDVWDAVNDLLFDLDLRAITKDVMDATDEADRLAKTQVLDDWFGDIPDPTLLGLYGDDETGGEA
jgi:hypothetical protein